MRSNIRLPLSDSRASRLSDSRASRLPREPDWLLTLLVLSLALSACESPAVVAGPERATAANATPPGVSFVDNSTTPFGTFGGVAFVRHTGMFEGETSLGEFRVPYEIIAPEDPGLGNGTVLVEPPHFGFGPLGRDLILGRNLLFDDGLSYASVGFGEHGLNILDPGASGLMLAGEPVAAPGAPNPTGILDEEILIQFTEALTRASFAADVLGEVDRLYAHGTSQTVAVLLEAQRNVASTAGPGLFDFTLLHTALWQPPFSVEEAFDFLAGPFEPLPNVGRVIFVESEGDQIISAAEQFRSAADGSGYRVYK